MTNEEQLKEIEARLKCSSSYTYIEDAEWLISRVKVLTEAVENHLKDQSVIGFSCEHLRKALNDPGLRPE